MRFQWLTNPRHSSVDSFWSWICVSIGWVSIPTTSKVQLPVLHFNYGKEGISCDANTILESYNIISNMYITMYMYNIETQPRYSIIICNVYKKYHYHIYIFTIILFNSTTFLTSASILDRFFYWPQVSLLSLCHSSRRMPQQLVLGESQGTCVPSALLNVESSATKTCTKTAISEEYHNKNRCAKVETSRFNKSSICLFWRFFNQGISRLLPEILVEASKDWRCKIFKVVCIEFPTTFTWNIEKSAKHVNDIPQVSGIQPTLLVWSYFSWDATCAIDVCWEDDIPTALLLGSCILWT